MRILSIYCMHSPDLTTLAEVISNTQVEQLFVQLVCNLFRKKSISLDTKQCTYGALLPHYWWLCLAGTLCTSLFCIFLGVFASQGNCLYIPLPIVQTEKSVVEISHVEKCLILSAALTPWVMDR